MGFLRLFKPPKHQTFSYKPRYWDPKEEEAEQRRQRIELLENGGVEAMKTRIKGGFSGGGRGLAGGEAATYRSARVKKSNSTLIIVLACLIVLAYVGMVYYVPEFDAILGNPDPGLDAPVGPPQE